MWKKNTSLLALVVVLVLPAIAWAGPILGPNNEQVKEQEVNAAYQTVANAIHVLTAFKQHGIADAIIGYSVSNWSLKWKIYGLAQTRNIPTCLVKSDKLDAFDWVKVIQQTHIHCADSLLKRVFKREDVIKLAEKIGSIYIHTEIKGKDDADEDVRHKAANKVKQYTDEALASLHKL